MTGAARAVVLVSCTALLYGCSAGQHASSASQQGSEPLYRSLTDHDVRMANQALDQALEHHLSGARVSWHNRGNGHRGSIMPIRSYRARNGGYCRDYREIIALGAEEEQYTATACRDRRGVWQPVN